MRNTGPAARPCSDTEQSGRSGTGASEPVPVRLVASGEPVFVHSWARARSTVGLHTVAPGRSWERLVRVRCLLAGSRADGAASVDALRTAITLHSGGPCSWARPRARGAGWLTFFRDLTARDLS